VFALLGPVVEIETTVARVDLLTVLVGPSLDKIPLALLLLGLDIPSTRAAFDNVHLKTLKMKVLGFSVI